MLLSTPQKLCLCQSRVGIIVGPSALETAGTQVTPDEHLQTQVFSIAPEVLSEAMFYFDFQRMS